MKIGMVGLGKMGSRMTERLLKAGHQVVVSDHHDENIEKSVEIGATASISLSDLVQKLNSPRAVWVMVPAGTPTESVLSELKGLLSSGDIVIDGGNSYYKETQMHAAMLADVDIQLIDVGTSGGIWGLTEGFSLMIGGNPEAVAHVQPIFEALAPAPDRGWGHVGSSGAGHFVKMVHNGIEYGMMQAYGEGFEILKAKEEFELDLHQIAEIWRFGTVIRSWLLDLTARALEEDRELSSVRGWVADSGEGRWTVAEAVDLDIPAPVITLSLLMRLASRQEGSFSAQVLAAMRNQFGGHAIRSK